MMQSGFSILDSRFSRQGFWGRGDFLFFSAASQPAPVHFQPNHLLPHFVIRGAVSKSIFNPTFNMEDPMKFRTSAALIAAAIVCLCALTANAQTKPDFSGSWKLNKEKSKFAGDGGPDAILIKIDHKEPALTEDWLLSVQNGERSFQAKYTTDGKETEQEVMGRTAKTSAKWEGDALVIEFKTADNGFFKRKITLSADGKTMTKIVTQSKGEGNQTEETAVFEKQ
jgi:hypothetical protein